MSEVQRDGNPHTYSEIPARTANLIVKPAIEDILSETEWVCRGVEWFSEQAKAEELTLQSADSQNIVFTLGEEVVPVAVRSIQHRRNGRHLVIQYQL